MQVLCVAAGRNRFVRTSAALALLSITLDAGANGRFPQSDLLVFEPGRPEHLLLRTTFGLYESEDRGQTFDWTCEAALGLQPEEDPMVTITGRGVRVAATRSGILRSGDGCGWTANEELAGTIVADLTLARSAPGRVLAYTVDGTNGGFVSELRLSDDDGETFTTLGEPLPDKSLAITVDVAPSDSSRVYVSARLGSAQGYAGVLLRSDDGGNSFASSVVVPNTNVLKHAYIAAVHPTDPDRVYVRVQDEGSTVLWLSTDAGVTFTELATGQSALPGFALSPNGERLAFGGRADGVWVGNSDGSELAQRSDFKASCLAWSEDGLYACSTLDSPFALALSTDEGETFEPLVTFDGLCATSRCAAASGVATSCRAYRSSLPPGVGVAESCRDDSEGNQNGGTDGGASAGNTGGAAGLTGDVEAAGGGCGFAAGRARGVGLASALLLCLSHFFWRRWRAQRGG